MFINVHQTSPWNLSAFMINRSDTFKYWNPKCFRSYKIAVSLSKCWWSWCQTQTDTTSPADPADPALQAELPWPEASTSPKIGWQLGCSQLETTENTQIAGAIAGNGNVSVTYQLENTLHSLVSGSFRPQKESKIAGCCYSWIQLDVHPPDGLIAIRLSIPLLATFGCAKLSAGAMGSGLWGMAKEYWSTSYENKKKNTTVCNDD